MDEQLVNFSKIELFEVRDKLLYISYADVLVNFLKILIFSCANNYLMMYIHLLFSVFIYIGLIGINRYIKSNIYFYICVNVITITISILSISLTSSKSFSLLIFNYLLFFMISIILKLNFKFLRLIKRLSNNDIDELKRGWRPPRYSYSYSFV
jgi:hypothetical protein